MMMRVFRSLAAIEILLVAAFLAGCETIPEGIQQARIGMAQRIQTEPSGVRGNHGARRSS